MKTLCLELIRGSQPKVMNRHLSIFTISFSIAGTCKLFGDGCEYEANFLSVCLSNFHR